MADSYILSTSEFRAGAKVRTNSRAVGENTVHEQYVIPISSDGTSQAVKLLDENGTAYGVKHVENKPRISSMPYLYDIAEGNVSGHSSWYKIGFSGSLVADTESDLWSKGGAYVFPASAIQMEVVSSDNTNDKASGTGALKVSIYYLDGDYAEHTEEVTLTGTAAVNTTATNIFRVNGFRVTSAGSTGKAAGNISLRAVGGAVTYSYISAGYTRARNSAYTVPAGKTLYVSQLLVGYGYKTNTTHYARIYTRATQNEGAKVAGIFYPFTEVLCSNSSNFIELTLPTKIVATVDIKVSAIATYAGTGTVALRGWIE